MGDHLCDTTNSESYFSENELSRTLSPVRSPRNFVPPTGPFGMNEKKAERRSSSKAAALPMSPRSGQKHNLLKGASNQSLHNNFKSSSFHRQTLIVLSKVIITRCRM